ncbi:hypothetical protein [Micromonospora endolithica]|uniref:Uncharacterized protein n=1 Tax=Micromonospora endolithica TaxID=230091 RepID=A0A3A9Z7N5_9ACTN|nr:hypothetical protein [Micromonospora endolithica]RKN44303.1 hypothetical protein D7223_18730 [Micromonospora endolithica]TWJ25780.1 hypothetical protein JD76_05954 [Micromonospora endolithica]
MNRRNPHQHTEWCAGGHRCGLGEHRSEEIVVDIAGRSRAVLVRVRTAAGREHAEVRVRVALAPTEVAARRQLVGLLGDMRQAVTRAAIAARPRPRPGR